jgi:hypothetical protein
MQEALPFLVALVLFVGAVVVLANRKPTPKTRNRYARWNAEHGPRVPRTVRQTRGSSRAAGRSEPPRPKS